MFATHNQENVTFNRQHAAAVKQQQGLASRSLGSKTPGAKSSKTPMKIPLNDENGAMTSKAMKGGDKSTFATPMTQRARAILGDKTTNAKAKGLQQTVNVKSAIQEIEKSQVKQQGTVRPRQRSPRTSPPRAKMHKLQVHTEESDTLSDEEVEYCPPRPTDLPYESDVFPDGVLTFDGLKPENMMKGYYRYYFNPIDENGVSTRDRQLAQETKKAIREGEKKIKEDWENLEWSVKAELGPDSKAIKKGSTSTKLPAPRKPLSTIRSRNAANVLSMNDTTMSMQRKAVKKTEPSMPLHKKSSSFAMPALRTSRPNSSLAASAIPKKSATEFDATSRTTIGYNRGRATASLLTKTNVPSTHRRNNSSTAAFTSTQRGIPRSDTTLSNDSDKTITPARFAHRQAAATNTAAAGEDYTLRDRVPFLSIFDHDQCSDDEEDDDPFGLNNRAPAFLEDEDEDEFELKLAD
ncbi:hypothetical protein F4678DRAFT_412654 [Xylaria arbuscula]|nr:hypothetical protein F4678DRAFT_412654 [Xylaria arbuscula]